MPFTKRSQQNLHVLVCTCGHTHMLLNKNVQSVSMVCDHIMPSYWLGSMGHQWGGCQINLMQDVCNHPTGQVFLLKICVWYYMKDILIVSKLLGSRTKTCHGMDACSLEHIYIGQMSVIAFTSYLLMGTTSQVHCTVFPRMCCSFHKHTCEKWAPKSSHYNDMGHMQSWTHVQITKYPLLTQHVQETPTIVAMLKSVGEQWLTLWLCKGYGVYMMSWDEISWKRLALVLHLSCSSNCGETGSDCRECYLIARGFDSVIALSNRI